MAFTLEEVVRRAYQYFVIEENPPAVVNGICSLWVQMPGQDEIRFDVIGLFIPAELRVGIEEGSCILELLDKNSPDYVPELGSVFNPDDASELQDLQDGFETAGFESFSSFSPSFGTFLESFAAARGFSIVEDDAPSGRAEKKLRGRTFSDDFIKMLMIRLEREPGTKVSALARTYGISRSIFYKRREEVGPIVEDDYLRYEDWCKSDGTSSTPGNRSGASAPDSSRLAILPNQLVEFGVVMQSFGFTVAIICSVLGISRARFYRNRNYVQVSDHLCELFKTWCIQTGTDIRSLAKVNGVDLGEFDSAFIPSKAELNSGELYALRTSERASRLLARELWYELNGLDIESDDPDSEERFHDFYTSRVRLLSE